jgi:hypothetical protein
VKIVGNRRTREDITPISPEEVLRRATVLRAQADLLNPYPRPRGFIFKEKTREDYERWRRATQSNPRPTPTPLALREKPSSTKCDCHIWGLASLISSKETSREMSSWDWSQLEKLKKRSDSN